MFCNRILGTTHHGTYKKVVDVPLLREELTARSIRCIARDGVEIEIDVYEDLQEGDILAETDFNVYAVKCRKNLRAQEKAGAGTKADSETVFISELSFFGR